MVKGRSQANAAALQALIAHWKSIVNSLNNCLKTMRANYVGGVSELDVLRCCLYGMTCLNVFVCAGAAINCPKDFHSDIFIY